MQTITHHEHTLNFVKSPPYPLSSRLQRFYSYFDGIEIALGEWYCPRVELPHLLLLDLCLQRDLEKRDVWVDRRISTLSIAQHIIVDAQHTAWNPLQERFSSYQLRADGQLSAVRQPNPVIMQVWSAIRSEIQ